VSQLNDLDIFKHYNEIYFIAHSMGGLVVKRTLVGLNRPATIEKLRQVKAVLYIATTARGSELAHTVYFLSSNPQLRDMAPADFNSFLRSIESQWENLFRERQVFPRSFCAHETKPTYGFLIVSPTYAHTYCDENPIEVNENHFNIVKPSIMESDIYVWARARILDSSTLAQGNESVSLQLTPHVLHYVHRYRSEGETIRQNEYGLGFIVRVRNVGEKPEYLKALEIAGDIDADPNDPALGADGKTFDELDTEYGQRKPYYRVSFVAFPIDVKRIEPGSEEYIRFLVLDPTHLETRAITRGDDGKHYVGFRGESPIAPLFLTTVPNIQSFVTFSHSEHRLPGNAQLFAPRLRKEIKSGELIFRLAFESGSHIIAPQTIPTPALISFESWNKEIPQNIHFRIWQRFVPITKDPLVETVLPK
jgi:hypothetical protein